MSQTLSTPPARTEPSDVPAFTSVLFLRDVPLTEIDSAPRPEHFHDLHLDDVAALVSGTRPGSLESYFRVPLRDVESVRYRQAAIHECEKPEVYAPVDRFARAFVPVNTGLAALGQLRHQLQRERCLLDTVGDYCRAVERLHEDLSGLPIESTAWTRLVEHLGTLVSSAPFTGLRDDHDRVRDGLSRVEYTLHIHQNRLRVDRHADESDLGAHVVDLFERFREGPLEDSRKHDEVRHGFSHVDAKVLHHVAQLFLEEFAELNAFWEHHRDFLDRVVLRLGREANLALAWVDLGRRLADNGLPSCLPELDPAAAFSAEDTYDIALATGDRAGSVVTNSIELAQGERLVVVTGPNQGGKTTFARMLGQTHYLAALGFPVPGSAVRLRLVDEVLTHFEREEEPGSERGKLKEDLIRMHEILQRVTAHSVVVLNEVFSSTTTADALGLARRVLSRLGDAHCLTVCVTFLDELAEASPGTVSMVAEVDSDDPSRRTFEIRRRAADGKAYADAIAGKYGLSRDAITRRVRS